MYDKRYFNTIEIAETEQANSLSEILIKLYDPKTVGDVGCATGLYLLPFHEKGISTIGWDNAGDAINKKLLPTVINADITKPLPKRKVDLVICLEVLEHIDSSLSSGVIENIVNLSDIIIFSAAQVGQKGTGHINCRPKEYWEDIFAHHGYVRDPYVESIIKKHVAERKHATWFQKNLQVLIRS